MPPQSAHSLLRNRFPMTGFRRVRDLNTYSGGTVPDFHRISYSLLSPNEFSSTQVYEFILIIATEKKFVNQRRFCAKNFIEAFMNFIRLGSNDAKALAKTGIDG